MTDFTPRNFAQIERHGGALKFLCVVFGLLLLIVLTACGVGKPSKDFYVRVTVDATYNGKAVGGSSVIKQTLINSAPRGNTRGEAVSMNLGNGKHIFMPMVQRSGMGNVYIGAIMKSFGQAANPERKRIEWEVYRDLILKLPYGTKVQWDYKWKKKQPDVRGKYTGYPLFVGFKNMKKPETVFLVETEMATRVYGERFKLNAIYLEKVSPDTPLTNSIVQLLPWADSEHEYWKRRLQQGEGGDNLKYFPHSVRQSDASLAQRLRRAYFSRGMGYE